MNEEERIALKSTVLVLGQAAHYAKKQQVVRHPSPLPAVWVVQGGALSVEGEYEDAGGGKGTAWFLLPQGTIFASGGFSPFALADVRAKAPSVVTCLPASAWAKAREANPRFDSLVTNAAMAQIARQALEAWRLSGASERERLRYALREWAAALGRPTDGGMRLDSVNRQRLAAAARVSETFVFRHLTAMCEEGLLKKAGGKGLVLSYALLGIDVPAEFRHGAPLVRRGS